MNTGIKLNPMRLKTKMCLKKKKKLLHMPYVICVLKMFKVRTAHIFSKYFQKI